MLRAMTIQFNPYDIRPTVQCELTDWSTMEQDIGSAHDIIIRHHAGEGPRALFLQEITIWLEGSIEIKQADWVVALHEHYENQYGEKKGDEVLRRVLTTLITHGFTVH